MAPWIARRLLPRAWRRIPWKMVWAVAIWLSEKGRERVETNLTQKERTELWTLVKKSKGRPGNLAGREQTRVRNIVTKAVRG
ncbi:MAG TPA: hypothetical protein VFY04_05990 [Solirubrobacterales bacterium]|nr:hypothetical protein [Solirubrobacterales bacterium]